MAVYRFCHFRLPSLVTKELASEIKCYDIKTKGEGGVKLVQQVWYFVQAEETQEGFETVVSVNKHLPQAQMLVLSRICDNTFMV